MGAIVAALFAATLSASALAQERPDILIFAMDDSGDPAMVRPAMTRSEPSDWVRDGDYPARALAAKRRGQIDIEVEVAADDRLASCKGIDSTPATAEFARAACAIVRKRGSFRHAIDADGIPRPDRLRLKALFAPPGESAAAGLPRPGIVAVDTKLLAEPIDAEQLVLRGTSEADFPDPFPLARLDVSERGDVTRCRIRTSVGTDRGDAMLCRRLLQARFTPARSPDLKPIAQRKAVAPKVLR